MSGSVSMSVSISSQTATTATVSWTFKATGNGVSWNSSCSYTISGSVSTSGSFRLYDDTSTRTVASGSFTVNKSTSTQTKSVTGKLVTGTSDFGTKSASGSVTIPALAKYTITLDPANGESTSNVTKTYGTNLTLGTPTWSNHTFHGWEATDGTTYIKEYTKNEATTLTAQWTVDYVPPKITKFTTSRNATTNTKVDISLEYTKGDGRSLTSVVLEYKLIGDSNWSSYGTYTSNIAQPWTLTTDTRFLAANTYEFRVIIADAQFSNILQTASVNKTGYFFKLHGESNYNGDDQYVDLNGTLISNNLIVGGVKPIIVKKNISINTANAVADTTYDGYTHRFDISISGCTENHVPEVIPHIGSGQYFCGFAESKSGIVSVWLTGNTMGTITIDTILLTKET